MKYDLIIRNGTVIREDRVERTDIAIENEKIIEIAPEFPGDARETIDATGLHVFPGVIDPHVHFNEPGRTEWEGFATGSAALAAGGGTLFFDMPLNSSPPVLNGESFDLKLAAAKRSSHTDFALWGGLTPKNLDRMEELAERGVVGFKAFMCDSGIDDFPHCDDYTLWRGMEKAAELGLVVAVHAENQTITSALTGELLNSGHTSATDYSASRPVVAEVEAIARAAALARSTWCKLHIVHVSSKDGAIAADMSGMFADVTYETCPHYLMFTTDDFASRGAELKCAPPLRASDDIAWLTLKLKSGDIEFVASDHSPSPPSMKLGADLFRMWGGIAGIQSTLHVLLGLELELTTVARLVALSVADRFCIRDKGRIAKGYSADLAFVDLDQMKELRRDDLLDRHKLSPYVGRTFRGVIRRTILRGRTIFMDGNVVAPPAGRFVRPAR